MRSDGSKRYCEFSTTVSKARTHDTRRRNERVKSCKTVSRLTRVGGNSTEHVRGACADDGKRFKVYDDNWVRSSFARRDGASYTIYRVSKTHVDTDARPSAWSIIPDTAQKKRQRRHRGDGKECRLAASRSVAPPTTTDCFPRTRRRDVCTRLEEEKQPRRASCLLLSRLSPLQQYTHVHLCTTGIYIRVHHSAVSCRARPIVVKR